MFKPSCTAAIFRPRSINSAGRQAFTLIELLVAITIILILSAVTIASFNYSVQADRIRSAARQFQSFLAGARDKAIYANDIRGVRLLLDPNDNHAVSGMQYIGSPQQETGLLVSDNTNDPTAHTMQLVSQAGRRWSILKNRGFLRVGCRIQIPSVTGAWYTVAAIIPKIGLDPELVLDRPVVSLVGSAAQVGYVIELSSGVLGDAQPVLFPRGVVIDLDGSAIPSRWRPSTGYLGGVSQSYSPQMDILFTPRGTIVGDCAALGILHLHFADIFDVTKWHTNINGRSTANYAGPLPIVPADNLKSTPPIIVVTRDRILATLVTRTGNVSVYNVNPTNSSTTGGLVADDAFLFAVTGKVANK